MMTSRILLLTTAHTYRAPSFLMAAKRLGIDVVQAVDMPAEMAENKPYYLCLDFTKLEEATDKIVQFAGKYPLQAILPVDDSGTQLAAQASHVLGLPYNEVKAMAAARDKWQMRTLLQKGKVPCPTAQRVPLTADLNIIAHQISYPCVVKPLQLSGSRGVIRADQPTELIAAFAQTKAIARQQSPQAPPYLLIEPFVPGMEVAVEGILYAGKLQLLALFDKPDPLDGPLFEETIYVTPSRLPATLQTQIAQVTAQAAHAIGLRRGPVHAELRINAEGVWLIEIAGRSIGGLCGQVLQFGSDVSLEELIMREAVGLPIASFTRESVARGVMMIPIPQAGLLREVAGIPEAEAIPLIERVEITAPLHNELVPLPAGDSYLGFIFAKGTAETTPAQVEHALRMAHQQLTCHIDPIIPLLIAT